MHFGVVESDPQLELPARLRLIAEGIDALVDEFTPDAMAVERVFAQQNLHSVMGTAQVSGIALLAAAKRDIPVGMHTPSEVKAAITGYGRAEKKQVQTMVARVLGLIALPEPADAADALALAICHAWRVGPAPAADTRTAGSLRAAAPATAFTPAQQAWRAAERKR